MQKQEVKKYLEHQTSLALEYKMKQGNDYQGFVERTHWSQQTPFSSNKRDNSTHGHLQMVNTKITLILLFAAEDEVLYSQHKQDLEPTLAQIMRSLLQNSGLNGRKQGKPLGHSGMT